MAGEERALAALSWISQWIATHLGKRENLMTGVFVALYCIKSIKDTASRIEACAEYFISTVRYPIPVYDKSLDLERRVSRND